MDMETRRQDYNQADPLAGFFIQDIPTNVQIRLKVRLSRIIANIANSAKDLTNSASG